MRGIDIQQVSKVELVKANHARIVDYKIWLKQKSAEALDTKFHEREMEREKLESLFDCSFGEINTHDKLVSKYVSRYGLSAAATSCLECTHCSADKFHPGVMVCWRPYQMRTQSRPDRLTSLTPCAGFAPRFTVSPGQLMRGFLRENGIAFSPARWAGHGNDLIREAGTWGYSTGTAFEQKVREAFENTPGAPVFIPQRWLIITLKGTSKQRYKEVDGIEWSGDNLAFVYEIKHGLPGWYQLTEYTNLLRIGYPDVLFCPVEINTQNCYESSIEKRDIHRIESLNMRKHEDALYQLYLWDDDKWTGEQCKSCGVGIETENDEMLCHVCCQWHQTRRGLSDDYPI